MPGTICIAGNDGKCSPNDSATIRCVNDHSRIQINSELREVYGYGGLFGFESAGDGLRGKQNRFGVVPPIDKDIGEMIDTLTTLEVNFDPKTANNGYPGIEKIRSCILRKIGPGLYPIVFWISDARAIRVLVSHQRRTSGGWDGLGNKADTMVSQWATFQAETSDFVDLQASPLKIGEVTEETNASKIKPEAIDKLPAPVTMSFMRQ